jgi:putative hydrolase of HD superfamily
MVCGGFLEAEAFRVAMSGDRIVKAAGKLKRIKRQGWLDAGIPAERAESVADHCFRTALLVAFLSDPDINQAKALKMALVHDLGEAEVGDLTPRSHVPKKKKAQMEEKAVAALEEPEVLSLWREFEEGKSPEAKAVRQADRYERVIQAMEYVLMGHPERRLQRFWKGVPMKLPTPEPGPRPKAGKKRPSTP